MMLLGDKKKLAATIVAKMKESKGGEKSDFVQKMGDKGYEAKEVDTSKPESDHEAGLHAAAGDLIKAIHAKDERRVHAALKAHYELCSNSDEESAGDEANEQSLDD